MTVSTKCILASISKYFTAHSSCFFSQLDWKSELFTSTHCWYYALCGDTQNSPQSHRQPPPVQYNSYIFVMVKLIVIFIDDMQGHFDCSCSWSVMVNGHGGVHSSCSCSWQCSWSWSWSWSWSCSCSVHGFVHGHGHGNSNGHDAMITVIVIFITRLIS